MNIKNNERSEKFLEKVHAKASDSRIVVLMKEVYDDLIFKTKSVRLFQWTL